MKDAGCIDGVKFSDLDFRVLLFLLIFLFILREMCVSLVDM